MKLCKTCIWANRKSGNKVVCPFIRCVKVKDWSSNKKGEGGDGGNEINKAINH